jgi:membrane protein implicated in regulation of membrane protease activity
VLDFSITALTPGDEIAIVGIVASVFAVVLGVLVAQYVQNRSTHKTQASTVELTNQRILARLVRALEGEQDEDGFQRTKGFMQRTEDRLGDLEGWRERIEAGKA